MFCSFFFSSRRRHTRLVSDWSSDVCSSDLIENAGALRTALGKRGHVFRSETDTEVLAHLIEELLAGAGSLVEAVAGALHQIGRASCRERVVNSGGAGCCQKQRVAREVADAR